MMLGLLERLKNTSKLLKCRQAPKVSDRLRKVRLLGYTRSRLLEGKSKLLRSSPPVASPSLKARRPWWSPPEQEVWWTRKKAAAACIYKTCSQLKSSLCLLTLSGDFIKGDTQENLSTHL
eukprot:1152050-Pelagomonas_calceolata.AAC.2